MPTQPLFEIGDDGAAKPRLPGEPDGRRRLSAEQAAEITGEDPEKLLAEFWATFTPRMPVGPEPTKAGDVAADPLHLLQQLYFPRIVDDQDLIDIMEFAKRRRLDAWCRQVWAERRYDEAVGADRLFIGATVEGLRTIAHATGLYAGLEDVEVIRDPDGQLEKARATVYRRPRKGSKVRDAFTASVLFDNYYPGPGFWDGREELMLAKCARAAALREAFPAELGGLYDRDEMVRSFARDGHRSHPRGPRLVKQERQSDAADEITDLVRFNLMLVTEFGVRDDRQRAAVVAKLSRTYPDLYKQDMPSFYVKAARDLMRMPEVYGLKRREEPAATGDAATA